MNGITDRRSLNEAIVRLCGEERYFAIIELLIRNIKVFTTALLQYFKKKGVGISDKTLMQMEDALQNVLLETWNGGHVIGNNEVAEVENGREGAMTTYLKEQICGREDPLSFFEQAVYWRYIDIIRRRNEVEAPLPEFDERQEHQVIVDRLEEEELVEVFKKLMREELPQNLVPAWELFFTGLSAKEIIDTVNKPSATIYRWLGQIELAKWRVLKKMGIDPTQFGYKK